MLNFSVISLTRSGWLAPPALCIFFKELKLYLSGSSYGSILCASVGTQMMEVTFSRSIVSYISLSSAESRNMIFPHVIILPIKPLENVKSCPIGPASRLMSWLLCSHDLEQYSMPVMRLLCVRGTILGAP